LSTFSSDRPETALLSKRFEEVFARIAEGAVEREQARQLPLVEVRELSDLGFGALRVPSEEGGEGASVEQLAELLTKLAAADPSVAHVFRATLGFTEFVLASTDDAFRARWIPEIVAGKFFWNGGTELNGTRLGETNSRVEFVGDGTARVYSKKQYTTGNLYGDWFVAYHLDPDEGLTAVIVSSDAPELDRQDTWNGFGQRLTATGTTIVDGAIIPADQVVRLSSVAELPLDFFQFSLVIVLAGIARGALRDGVDAIRRRTRSFSHASAALPKDDPLIQELVGRLSAKVLQNDAVVARVARSADELFAARASGAIDAEQFHEGAVRTHAELFQAQVLLYENTVEVASDIFHGLGASAISRDLALDRHWRNARTVAAHNPIPYRNRDVGAYVLNGTEPHRSWGGVGEVG
jgi:alkylation response protein AidB-like acyl-CoA dehydrogenase